MDHLQLLAPLRAELADELEQLDARAATVRSRIAVLDEWLAESAPGPVAAPAITAPVPIVETPPR